MQRFFLLYPYGGEVPPQGEVRKIGWIPGAKPAARVLLQGDSGMLLIGEPGREISEQQISTIAAKALLEATGKNRVTVAEAESAEWQVRQYEGLQWGVVMGVVETQRPDDTIPVAPTGWKLGREITGTAGADEFQMAQMSPATLAEYQTLG